MVRVVLVVVVWLVGFTWGGGGLFVVYSRRFGCVVVGEIGDVLEEGEGFLVFIFLFCPH